MNQVNVGHATLALEQNSTLVYGEFFVYAVNLTLMGQTNTTTGNVKRMLNSEFNRLGVSFYINMQGW